MINLKRRQPLRKARLNKQRGGALILIAFMIGIALTAFVIKNFDTFSVKAEQDARTMEALGQAKEGLISWAVSHSSTPGQLPWPDRRETTSPNYDGQSDCSNANFNLLNSASEPNFLGQIPTIASTTPCQVYPGVGNRFLDSSGNNIWYAVSRNLVRRYSAPVGDPIINPGIINSPTYPWMIVRNSAGAIISDRVAVVIIAPGPALSGQDRSGDAPLPANYLDQVTIGGVTYANFDYDTDNEDFIIGDITGGTFNDRLVYITIDELMVPLSSRVGETVKFSLDEYRDDNIDLPYAAQLGTTENFSPEEDKLEGLLPVHYQACSYRRESFSIFGIPIRQSTLSDCSASIFDPELSGISSIRFTSPTGTFNNDQDSCVASGAVCTCAGTGNCTGPGATRFQCADSNCFAISIDNFDAWGIIDINGGKFTHRTGGCAQTTLPTKTLGCTNSDAIITCSGASSGSFASSTDEPFGDYLPDWVIQSEWYKHVYYYINRDSSGVLTSGDKLNLDAVILTTGKPIELAPFASKGSAQVRPSCDSIDNYLDSAENADGDTEFDAVGTKRSSNYNDQIFIMAP